MFLLSPPWLRRTVESLLVSFNERMGAVSGERGGLTLAGVDSSVLGPGAQHGHTPGVHHTQGQATAQ